MKKKFNFWLQLVTICLCICAIAVGVYSVTTTSITASGKVGFEAHGVSMNISGTLTGYVSQANVDTATDTETKNLTASLTTTKTTDTMDLGTVYFTDLVLVEGKVPDIVLTLNFTNISLFAVKATISASTLLSNDDITVTQSATEVKMGAKNGTGSVIITFKLNSADDTITALDLSSITTPIIVFDKSTGGIEEGELYIDETTNTLYVNYGTFPNDVATYGEMAGKAMRWAAFAVNTAQEGETLTAVSNITQVPTSGTYYFISEYVLEESVFTNDSYDNDFGGYDYESAGDMISDYAFSVIRERLASSEFITKFNLTNLISKVTERTLPQQQVIINYDDEGNPIYKDCVVNCTDSLWILDIEEVNHVSAAFGNYNAKIHKNGSTVTSAWWTCTITGPSHVFIMDTTETYVESVFSMGVRPAFQLNLGA